MSSWKSITKAVNKPFKEAGKGWWTDVRVPVLTAAAVTAAVFTAGALAPAAGAVGAAGTAGAGVGAGAGAGSAAGAAGAAGVAGVSASTATAAATAGAAGWAGGLSALGSSSTLSAIAGSAYLGYSIDAQRQNMKAQKASDAATLEAAHRLAASQSVPTVQAATASVLDTLVQENRDRLRRRYALSRTVNGSSLLGSLGRSTLG